MESKKGQIGSTLTWMIATFIIFFVMVLFISATISLVTIREIPVISWIFGIGKASVTISGFVPEESLSAEKGLMSFANSYIEVNGQNIKIKDMLETENTNEDVKVENFKNSASDFLGEYYPIGQDKNYYASWIKVYSSDESDYSIDSKRYSLYGVDMSNGRKCSLGVEGDLISEVDLGSKKIVICLGVKI